MALIPREDAEGSTAKPKAYASSGNKGTSEGTASQSGDEGDPRKMKEAEDQKNEPTKQRKAKPRVRARKAGNGKEEGSKARSKGCLEEAVEAPLKGKELAAQSKIQGELPLQDQNDEEREADASKEHSPRSDRPDPDAAQREGDPMLKRIDLAYALNAHMAQGLTSDRGIAVMDSRERNLSNQKTFLVTVTRLRDHVTLILDNTQGLTAAVARNKGEKASALEVISRLKAAATKGGDAPQEAASEKNAGKELEPIKSKALDRGI